MEAGVTEGGGRLNAALLADHAALEAALKRFCSVLSTGSPEIAQGLWDAITSDLGAHLRAEERHILPVFERAYPHHGAMIRRHHDELRRALEAMSVELSRDRLEPSAVDGLLEVLRRHARHEEVVFYYWARLHLDDQSAERVVEKLHATKPRRDPV
jgi:hypothetical protein